MLLKFCIMDFRIPGASDSGVRTMFATLLKFGGKILAVIRKKRKRFDVLPLAGEKVQVHKTNAN